MRARRSCCAKSGIQLRTIAARLCLLALAAAVAGGCAELLYAQAQQPASQDPAQAAKPNSGPANPSQSGAQNTQPQQNNGTNSGSSAGAPMVIGEGDDEGAPAEQAPRSSSGPSSAQLPAQAPTVEPAPAQPGQNAAEPDAEPAAASDDHPAPSAGQQTVPAAPAVPSDPDPALAALPPGPPDSADPRKLVNWECADLLKMANDLKLAVDKTTKDELSLSVVRKAGEIEQMAHKLRDDMRPAMAGKN